LLNDEDFRKEFKIKNEKKSIRDYIENHFERINIIIYDESNKFLMNLIEALLHFKYEPMYEKG
jgi:predicted ATP-binding protein involved in virulence